MAQNPDWYRVAVDQADRVFGDFVYMLISRVVNSNDWSDDVLVRFQGNVVRGIEIRGKVIEKFDGIIALQRLSVEPKESGDAIHGFQSET